MSHAIMYLPTVFGICLELMPLLMVVIGLGIMLLSIIPYIVASVKDSNVADKVRHYDYKWKQWWWISRYRNGAALILFGGIAYVTLAQFGAIGDGTEAGEILRSTAPILEALLGPFQGYQTFWPWLVFGVLDLLFALREEKKLRFQLDLHYGFYPVQVVQR